MAKVWSSLDKLLLHHSHRRIEYRRSTSHILHGFPCDCPGCLQTQTSSHMHHIQTLADWYLLLWYLSLETHSGINQRLGLLSSRGEEVLNPCGFSLCVSSGRCQTWRHQTPRILQELSFFFFFFFFFCSSSVTLRVPPLYLGNREWYHRSAGVKTTGKIWNKFWRRKNISKN